MTKRVDDVAQGYDPGRVPDINAMLDAQAIRDLTAAYSDAVTHLDARRAAALYAEDGAVAIMGQRTHGRAAIEAAMADSFAAFDLLQLIAHGPVIHVTGDSALARWSTIELAVRRGGGHVAVIFGRYEDSLVRIGVHWRFQERIFTLAGRTQMPVDKLQVLRDAFLSPAHTVKEEQR